MTEVCKVPDAAAREVARDVLARARSVAAQTMQYVDVLVAPFVEESYDHEPAQTPLWLKAATTLVVRNSLLEEQHVRGLVEDGGLRAITRLATAPLSHYPSRPGDAGC